MGETDRLHSGQRAQAFEERIGERDLLLVFLVFFLRQREPQDGGVGRIESGIDVRQPHEAAREKARSA